MNDRSVLEEIQHLEEEERSLRARAGNDGLSDEEQMRLQHLEVSLDQCWDFLRQRRARRDDGPLGEPKTCHSEAKAERTSPSGKQPDLFLMSF